MIYINDKGDIAKLIELKDGIVKYSLNEKPKDDGEPYEKAWHDFIKEFRGMGNEQWHKTR